MAMGPYKRRKAFHAVLQRQQGRCNHCGEPLQITPAGGMLYVDRGQPEYCGEDYPNWILDHRVPTGEGGSDDLDNLQLLCLQCERIKTRADIGRISRAAHGERRWESYHGATDFARAVSVLQ